MILRDFSHKKEKEKKKKDISRFHCLIDYKNLK